MNKKIISIEDRIPKLKQQRKKKANRRLVFYLSIFFILISIIIYLQSPLSNIKTIVIKGNSLVSEQEVIDISEISKRTNIWTVNTKKVEKRIKSNPAIENIEVRKKLPRSIEIKIDEYKRVGYVEVDHELHPILNNGETLPVQSSIGDAPILLDFTEEASLQRMVEELDALPTKLLNLISEIYWKPSESNQNKIQLFMNDGFIVNGTIRGFSDKMQIYPSIVSQLDSESKGIVHIGVGAYFEELTKKDKD